MLSTENHKTENLDEDFDLKVSYLADQKIIKIVASGNLTAEANQQLVLTTIEASRQFDSNRILLDERNVTVSLSFVDIYDLPQINEQLGVSSNFRVAIIYSKSFANDKAFGLYENRAVISDLKHHIFYDEDSAIHWLLSDS